MGIGLMSAFKVIPWVDVIAAAPAVVDGAKKLWALARERNSNSAAATRPQSTEGRIRELEAQVSDLKRESAASAELIKSLAEQNAQLVKAVEILRVRTRALLAASVVAVVILAIIIGRLLAIA